MIVVTGATGNIGRPLVELLVARGHAVSTVSRGTRATPTGPRPGVTPVVADLAAPEQLEPVLDGARSLFLLVPGNGAALDVRDLLGRASRRGVESVTVVSSQAAGTRPDHPAYAPFLDLEHAARESGLAWTVLRPAGLASNAYAWAESIRSAGSAFSPFADVALPAVDPRDVADVAASTLTDPTHAGTTWTLTGPQATTPRERVAQLGTVLGRDLTLVEVSADEARTQMRRSMPDAVVDGTLALLGSPVQGERAPTTHVPDVLGRPARTFERWAHDHAEHFRRARVGA